MNGRSTRIVLLGALALAAVGCASIWGFQDFGVPGDASPDVSGIIEGDDSTVEDAGPPPSMGDDGTVDSMDSPTLVEAAEEEDVGDAGPASDSPCPSGQTLCGSQCLDTTSDPAHCGSCQACPLADMICASSTCVCAPAYHLCNGLCSSNLSPYSCGTTSCTLCETPYNGTSNNCTDAGCGTCAPTYTLCNANTPDAACVSFATDTTNCGACGTVCRVPDAGGEATCSGTPPACGMTCNTGLTACPPVLPIGCVNVLNDIHNCGGCSRKCPAHDGGTAATCIDGGCH